jgi:molybdopterin/thiamine biosynthesis adenylyltransferase
MALANFFDKAALAAADVLQGYDHAAFRGSLTSHTVGLAFDAAAGASFEGRTTLDLAANLLARLYPRLAVVPLERGLGAAAAALRAGCRAINPGVEIARTLKGVSACLVVGDRAPDVAAPSVYVGSDGWVVRVSAESPVGSGAGTTNPFGAAAAACFGAANVFRVLFAGQLPHGGPDRRFTLSLIDFVPNAAAPQNPPLPAAVDVGEAQLVGLGAIGNGAVWALARVPSVRGSLDLVDHEAVELSNLQRYVLTTQRDRGEPKVEVAARALARTALTVRQHPDRWGDYLRTRGTGRLERVAVGLDSARDRIAVQAGLPRWVCNAWTQPGDLGVSRHEFLGTQACLACLYLPDGVVPNEDEVVARAINMPEAREEIRTLLFKNGTVGEAFVRRMATALGVAAGPLLPFAQKPLRAFYADAVCGGVLLKLGASGGAAAAQVPMAFQSALAGVLLAAELVANAAALKGSSPPGVTRINLLRPLGEFLTLPEAKRPGGRCLCQDPDYVSTYRAKYPDVVPAAAPVKRGSRRPARAGR